jgi:hypothetical protein
MLAIPHQLIISNLATDSKKNKQHCTKQLPLLPYYRIVKVFTSGD